MCSVEIQRRTEQTEKDREERDRQKVISRGETELELKRERDERGRVSLSALSGRRTDERLRERESVG